MNIPGTTDSTIWTVNTDNNTTITVQWPKMGDEFVYQIMIAKNPNGPWRRVHDIRLTDNIVDQLCGISQLTYVLNNNNIYKISGLNQHTKYSVKIMLQDKYDSWWISYKGSESIEGGLLLPESKPSPDYGNVLGFQFEIN